MAVIDAAGRTAKTAGSLLLAALFVLSGVLVHDAFSDNGIVGEADGIRRVEAYVTMVPTGSNQKGNVVELRTGPGEIGFADQFFGNVSFYRTSKVLRDRIMVSMYFESDDPGLVLGSVTPQVFDVQPGGKVAYQPISVSIRLASPMLDYSTGINPMVRVKVWGEWFAQWSAGQGGAWDGGIIEPYYIYVHIIPYHYLQMSFDPAMVSLGPGGSGEIDVIVMNTGNGHERVDLIIPNENIYAKEGWIFEFNRTTLDIGPRSEARARIRVTSPRSTIRWHMDTQDFTVMATSYYDRYQAKDEGREDIHSYEMTFMVYIFGLDFTYVPWAWAAVFWSVLALVLLNLGINPLTMRRRKLPRGKEPGFIALRSYLRSPERRERVRLKREEKSRLKRLEKERSRAEKERKKTSKVREKEAPPSRERFKAEVLDLRKVGEDDMDFEIPGIRERPPERPGSPVDDDMEIVIERPPGKKKSSGRSLFPSRRERSGRSEQDLKEVLEEL